MKKILKAATILAVLGFFAATAAVAFDFNNPPQKPKNPYSGGSIMMQQGSQNAQPSNQNTANPTTPPKTGTTWVNKVVDSPEREACLKKCREEMEKSNESCKKFPDPPSVLACQQGAGRTFDACQKKCPSK